MRYIAVNTASPIIEILAVHDEKRSYATMQKVMAAEQLLPRFDEMLENLGFTLDDFDDFVCVIGPGSFTGIRIGVNTMRAFAYALKKNVYGVTYGKVMSYNSNSPTVTLIDGGSGVCYAAAFSGGELKRDYECIYKANIADYLKDWQGEIIADFEAEGIRPYVPDVNALGAAAEYAIKNKIGTQPLYIRKPQPDRTETDI